MLLLKDIVVLLWFTKSLYKVPLLSKKDCIKLILKTQARIGLTLRLKYNFDVTY